MTKSVSQSKIKPFKEYYCPYCGKQFKNSEWTYDHIIPLGMGGPKKFKIISCFNCNHKISKIEQKAIFAPSIRSQIINLGIDGHQITHRRKNELLPVHRMVGESGGKPVKLYYKTGDAHLSLVFLGDLPQNLTAEEYNQQFQHGQAIIPIDKHSSEEYKSLLILVNKIFLGCGHWLWGKKFSESKIGCDLREKLLDVDLKEVDEIDESDNHAIWDCSENEELIGSEISHLDALDNHPDTTINFFQSGDLYFGLINILGEFESMIRLGSADAIKLFDDKDKGIIIIAGSTKNQMKKMTITEYEKYKTDQFAERDLLK